MRVLYSFPTRLGVSGIGMTAWHQVSGAAEHGAEVTVLCASNERPLPPGVRVVETLRPAGLKVPFRVVGYLRALDWHDRRAAAALRRLAGRIDLVHAWPLRSERLLTAARDLGVPSVLERPNAHTGFAFDAVEKVCADLGIPVDPSSPHARQPGKLAIEEREYALAGRLLCPSDFVARTFLDAGTPAGRLLRHRYGYDPGRFHTEGRDDSGRPFTVGFVGRGEPRKGLHDALRAWLRCGAADAGGRFVIAGSIDPGYRRVIEEPLAHPSVTEAGHVPDPAALMRGCDVLVLPSVEEGSALVTYEARACGCVLVVSDHSGAPGTDGVDALFHPAGDVDALTERLRSLWTDPELLARLRTESVRGAGELTWSAAGAVLTGAYREAAGAP
ncbi:glycosyltransferase family 4 protein [Actinoplanes hulinensis]|uniref:Glycosyltransferase family 4 protein n=1 Tax=Actinoplanes hulinensis TaxID=1144547 RepID=A0ABS7BDT0_9ACTN|nr:glycosyltransferase family 4 protein [Actinoplanes hulinensis]MBW6438624.1 glycosyltransferase family 4 protein [Actinoplanes hulinensis]